MTIGFREAKREDVPAVLALLRDDRLGAERETASDDTYFAAWEEMQREGANLLIVGELNGRIVATYQLTFISGMSLRATRRAQIESVRVAQDARRQGLGRAMLEDAEGRSRAAGCQHGGDAPCRTGGSARHPQCPVQRVVGGAASTLRGGE